MMALLKPLHLRYENLSQMVYTLTFKWIHQITLQLAQPFSGAERMPKWH